MTTAGAGDPLPMTLSRRSFLIACSAMAAAGCNPPTRTDRRTLAWGSFGTRDGDFVHPRAIGVRDGEVYVVDKSGRIQVFTMEGEFLRLWRMPESENGTPTCVAFARDGRVLVPDTHYSRIAEYTRDGELLRMWGSYGSAPGQFIYPTGVVESPDGHYFISEYGEDAERVQVFDAERTPVRTWGTHGDAPGQFNRAMALAVAGGVVLVADTTNHRVQCFDPDGTLLRVIGTPGTGRGQLKFPHDIAVAPDGSLLLCEYGANRVSRFDTDGSFLGAFGAPGRGPGEFSGPRGVAVSEAGDVFVADTENHRVQRFRLEAVL